MEGMLWRTCGCDGGGGRNGAVKAILGEDSGEAVMLLSWKKEDSLLAAAMGRGSA